MKLKKIELIENPSEGIQLNADEMDMLLGGISCSNWDGKYCGKYKNGADCDSPTTLRCKKYTI